jgi:arylsulfatase A-like enzyme
MRRFNTLWAILFNVALLAATWPDGAAAAEKPSGRPNILVVIADQWRAEAFGFAGNADVKTPHLDRLHGQCIDFPHALSTVPVCCPARASFLTGQRALTHGVFLNDVPLDPAATTLAKVLGAAGYDTGFIGKWHLNGDGRSAFIPRERRQGFDYWKALECSHDYNHSFYYADGPEKRTWEGYDVVAQTRDAQQYLRDHMHRAKPFLLFLSWGPPHDPYQTAPERYRAMYEHRPLALRPNVPPGFAERTHTMLAGYYAHCTAMDDCIGQLRQTLEEAGLAENTILVFTADHGDMLGSHGARNKQQPYDESIRVPLLIAWPAGLGRQAARRDVLFASEDLMPTLLGLAGVGVPRSVEGLDYSDYLRGGRDPSDDAALISCPAPFGQWVRAIGGREYRGVRTLRYTYVRDLHGPWLLFDDQSDPYQQRNLVGDPARAKLQAELDAILQHKLRQAHDEFRPAADYVRQWGYKVDASGTVRYEN